MSQERWVTVHNADTAVEAQAALDFLSAHGVRARSFPHPDPHLAGAPVSPGWGTIQVQGPQLDDATRLLVKWEEDPPQELAEPPATQPLLGHSPQQRPAWAQPATHGWLWWALILSVLGNLVLAGLWWEARQQIAAAESASQTR
ncbi:MAG: hypothetical protein AAFQ82_12140 [Myxococcota bacterium]